MPMIRFIQDGKTGLRSSLKKRFLVSGRHIIATQVSLAPVPVLVMGRSPILV